MAKEDVALDWCRTIKAYEQQIEDLRKALRELLEQMPYAMFAEFRREAQREGLNEVLLGVNPDLEKNDG